MTKLRAARRAVLWLTGGTAGVAGATAFYVSTHDVWKEGLGDYVRDHFTAERAHLLSVTAARWGLAAPGLRRSAPPDNPILKVRLWGLELPNPIGLAAGFDKHAEAVPGLFACGFGLVEVGTVTPRQQPGNPKPRVWRLEEDRAVINRYGFPSVGLDRVQKRLARLDGFYPGALGVNVGMNKDAPSPIADFAQGVAALGAHADYVVVNVSSPNTAGLRSLQRRDTLRGLLTPLIAVRDSMPFRPPLLVKVAPDLTASELADVAAIALELSIDGVIVSNTTVERPASLQSKNASMPGGLSGRPLRRRATEMVGELYRITNGQMPIVGVGGVESGQDAYDKIRAGASVVQIYTALVFEGPWLIDRVKSELVALLKRDGFESVEDAIGADYPAIRRKRNGAPKRR